MVSYLSIILLVAIIWSTRMAYITPSPQRRSIFILSTLILIVVVSSYLNPLAPQATINGISDLNKEPTFGSPSLALDQQVPDRKTELTVDERTDSDVRKHTFVTKYYDAQHPPSTLILVATKNDRSWGRNSGEPDRSLTDFLDMISRQQLPPHGTSIGLLTSDQDSLDHYTTIILSKDIPVASVGIIYAPKSDFQVGPYAIGRSFRLRNMLMEEMLKKEAHIVWVDPDIYELPEGLFNRFHEVAKKEISKLEIANVPKSRRSKLLPLGIMTVMCRQTSYKDMARNAYSGPSEAAMKKWQEDKNRKPLAAWPKPMSHIVEKTSDDTLVRLDGVGETVLYIRADLIRNGLRWPDGDKTGSEELCSSARDMGWGCYGLGGSWETKHTNM